MKHVEQKVIWYRNYELVEDICDDMNTWIANGWRVHTCLNKISDVLVVYEKDLETWN